MISIHPTSIVETDRIGDGTTIGPFCWIGPRVAIGRNCNLAGYCSLGQPPQWKTPPADRGGIVVVGDGVTIREFSSLELPAEEFTLVGDGCFISSKAAITHDCRLGRDCFIAPGASLGGFTKLGNRCYIGLNASTHQRATLGEDCLLGAGSFFKGTSPERIIWAGVPARRLKFNEGRK